MWFRHPLFANAGQLMDKGWNWEDWRPIFPVVQIALPPFRSLSSLSVLSFFLVLYLIIEKTAGNINPLLGYLRQRHNTSTTDYYYCWKEANSKQKVPDQYYIERRERKAVQLTYILTPIPHTCTLSDKWSYKCRDIRVIIPL